jgi:hypothetical protein
MMRLLAVVAMASRLTEAISNCSVNVLEIEQRTPAMEMTLTCEKRVLDMKSFQGTMVDLSVCDSYADMCRLLVDFRIAMSLLVP